MAKPTFFESLKDGAIGFVKGAFTLGVVGLIAGAAIGGLAASTGLFIPGSGLAGAIFGGSYLAGIGMSIGGTAGALIGVMQGREGQVSDAQDLVNMNKMAFAQGVAAGRDKNVSHEATQELAQASRHFQDQLAEQKSGALVR